MRRLAALLIACSCTLPAGSPDERVSRVANGVYTLRFDARRTPDGTLVPARSSFIVGPEGVAVIDTGMSYADGRAILDAIAHTTDAPVRIAILTHPSQEAIFGAAAFAERGVPVAMHADAARLMAARCGACLERLRGAFGTDAMKGTRLVEPARELRDGETLRDTGRPLTILAPAWSSAPGAVALLDGETSTLIAGSLVTVAAVPDLRDGDVPRWRAALARLAATRCAHLVPAHGPIGTCRDIEAFRGYLEALDARVAELFARGVELGDVAAQCELPRYASWEGYADLHGANASREYLRLERAALARP
jgi:glyoxylase-like metal-dependent hydrolase (beta-lactamase superfamily II)